MRIESGIRKMHEGTFIAFPPINLGSALCHIFQGNTHNFSSNQFRFYQLALEKSELIDLDFFNHELFPSPQPSP